MTQLPADLQALLSEALARVGEPRRVLAQMGQSYASSLDWGKAVVLGGAPAPGFLRRDPHPDLPAEERIPFCLPLTGPRLLLTAYLGGEVEEWLPLLEELVREDETLLVIAEETEEGDLLSTFLVNLEREVLWAGVAAPGRELRDLAATIATATGSSVDNFSIPGASAPDEHVRIALPLADAAYLRQDTCFLFPSEDQDWEAALEEIAVIQVGGRDADEQRERLLLLCEALRSGA